MEQTSLINHFKSKQCKSRRV